MINVGADDMQWRFSVATWIYLHGSSATTTSSRPGGNAVDLDTRTLATTSDGVQFFGTGVVICRQS